VVVSDIFGIFTLIPVEMIQFDEYFSQGLVQPPTCSGCVVFWGGEPCFLSESRSITFDFSGVWPPRLFFGCSTTVKSGMLGFKY